MSPRSRGSGRIYPRKGSTFWWCAYYLRGQEFRESTGETEQNKAEKYLKHRLKEVGADQIGAKPFVGPRQERVKVSELLSALEDDYELRDKDSPQFRTHLKHIREYFGAWRALEISPEAVDSYIKQRHESGAAAGTINRSTQLLHQAFSIAVARKHLAVAPKIRRLSEKGNARQGFFNDADFHMLSNKLPSYLHDFTQFGYLTGWRKGEIASLRWEDVDGDIIRLRAQNAKNGEGRIVPLEDELAELIARRKACRQVKTKSGVTLAAWIFHKGGEPVGDFRKAWATACVAAGLGRFICCSCKQTVDGHKCVQCKSEVKYSGRIFHDFRRTAVRNMVRAGVPERTAMDISGHKTRSIFDRYNIVNEADRRDAMQRTQSYLKNGAQAPDAPVYMHSAGGES